jgi:hypothetical protein
MNVNRIEYHLEFYTEDGEQVEHYGNRENAFIAPRQGERVSFLSKKRTFEVTRVVHEFIEYEPFSIGYVTRVYGRKSHLSHMIESFGCPNRTQHYS